MNSAGLAAQGGWTGSKLALGSDRVRIYLAAGCSSRLAEDWALNSSSKGVPEVVERCSGGILTVLEMLLMKNCVAGRSLEFLTSSSTFNSVCAK